MDSETDVDILGKHCSQRLRTYFMDGYGRMSTPLHCRCNCCFAEQLVHLMSTWMSIQPEPHCVLFSFIQS